MKRYISLLITVIMVTILVACGREYTPVSSSSERINSSSESSTGVNLSEIYTNEVEGISFKYPSAWVPVEKGELNNFYTEGEIPTVLLLLENKIDEGNLSSYIEVLKFPASQSDIDHLYISDEEFASTFDDNVSIKETGIVDLNGVSARMIVYTTPDDVIYRSYFYGVGSSLYRVNFLRMQEKTGNLEPFFDAVLGSYKITATATSSSEISLPASSVEDDGFMIVTAEPSLRMRSGEGTQYEIITEIPYGEKVFILNSIDPEWFEVRYGEYVGYVLSEYLAPVNSSSMSPEEAANIVYNIVGPGYSMEVDREEGNSYIIHVYTDNGGTTATLDWFTVDKSTGAVEASFGYFDSVG